MADGGWRCKALERALPFCYLPNAPLAITALCSPVAQLVEQAAVNRWVAGSSPARGAISFPGYLSPGSPLGLHGGYTA